MDVPTRLTQWPVRLRYAAFFLVALLLGLFATRIRVLLGPISVAALLAFLLHPLAVWVQRKLIKRWTLAVTLVYGLFLVLLFGGLVALGPVLASQSELVVDELQTIIAELQSLETVTLAGYVIPIDWVANQLVSSSTSVLRPEQAFGVLRSISANFGWVLITFFCAFYFLKDGQRIVPGLIQLAPTGFQDDFGRIAARISLIWQAYLRGQLLLMVVVGVATGLGMAALGVRSALTIGIITGLLDIVPSVGPGLAAIVALLVTAVEGSLLLPIPTPILLALVVLLYGIIQTAENVWLRPRIMGERLNLHPAVIFVAIIASLTLSGVLLALFIIPTLSSFQVILSYLRHRIYGLDPWATA